MSALLESFTIQFKSNLTNNVAGFFKQADGFKDMDHTHIARVRLRVFNQTINCLRYPCTIDWYFNRYLVDEDEEESEVKDKFEEFLILKVLCRQTPSISSFNKEDFMASLNQQIENSTFIKEIRKYYIASKT